MRSHRQGIGHLRPVDQQRVAAHLQVACPDVKLVKTVFQHMHRQWPGIPAQATGQRPVLHRHTCQPVLRGESTGTRAGLLPAVHIGKGVGRIAAVVGTDSEERRAACHHQRRQCNAQPTLHHCQQQYPAPRPRSRCASQGQSGKGGQRHPGGCGPVRQATATAREVGQHRKGNYEEQHQPAVAGICHTANTPQTPQQQWPIDQQLHHQKTRQVHGLPAAACTMLNLIGERYPLVLRIPDDHWRNEQQGQQCSEPHPWAKQQAPTVRGQQTHRHSGGGEHRSVFTQARQPQQQPQHHPLA